MSAAANEGPPLVKSADRTMRVLELLGRSGPMSFTELQKALEMPKSSAHSLIATMTARGWVALDRTTGGFRLGYRARILGVGGVDESELSELADGPLTGLRDRLDETAHFAQLAGTDILYLLSKYSNQVLGVRFKPGRRLPAYASGLGKAMLSTLEPAELDEHLPATFEKLTPKTLGTRAQLDEQLVTIRANGFAEDDEEGSIGVHCFAVAIAHPDAPLTAISVSMPEARFTPELGEHTVAELRRTRDEIVALLS
jgi:DNA-binding IclR family transcriptional regulator